MNDITALAQLVSKAKASVFTLEYISQFEAADIDSDDVDLRFEVDGVETGTNVSIVDECGQAAQMITALVEALEKAQRYIERLREWNADLAQESCEHQNRIAELESRTVNSEKLQESSYRAGLTTGWNLGLENNNVAFNKCLTAHSTAGIAELESRTVTVKLPAEYLNADGSVNADMANTCPVVSAYREAHRAVGIQVIEGEGQRGGNCE